MAKNEHASQTPAVAFLKAQKVDFTEHSFAYVPHGGAQHSAKVLGLDPWTVVKTLIMEDNSARPLVVLMHGNCTVSTKNLARQIGVKAVQACSPDQAQRNSGYLVGGTSPFGTRRSMPVYVEASILDLAKIWINGGRRGYLLGIDPEICVRLLGAVPVHCAIRD